MTDRHRRNSVLRETLGVVIVSAGLAVSLTAMATMKGTSASVRGAMEKAAASIDPGIESRGAALRDSVERGGIVVAGLPAGFFVRLDGLAYPAAGHGVEIRTKPGSHRVEICNNAGDSWVTRISVPPGGRIGLEPALGGEIVIEPADGEPLPGDVYLDGKRIEQLPAVIDSAAVGTHTAEIRSDMGGVLWRSDIVVRNGAITQVALPSKSLITTEN